MREGQTRCGSNWGHAEKVDTEVAWTHRTYERCQLVKSMFQVGCGGNCYNRQAREDLAACRVY